MYARILVGLDGSELAELALPYAASLAERFGATLVLLSATAPGIDLAAAPAAHAAAAGVARADAADLGKIAEALRRESAAYLKRVARSLRRHRCAVEFAAVDGPAAAGLLAHARATGVDLLVLTTRGRGGLGRMLLGSVADAVARQAPCAVLLVRADVGQRPPERADRFARILVALDGSPRAERVLPHVQALANAFGSKVVLLEVDGEPLSGGQGGARLRIRAIAAMGRVPRRAYLAHQVQRLRHRGVDADYELDAGDPVDVLVRRSEELPASMVALTTRGRGGIDRLVLGSVADAVVRRAPCPVLVVRVGSEADAPVDQPR